MFNLAINSKVRGGDLVRLRIDDVLAGGRVRDRATMVIVALLSTTIIRIVSSNIPSLVVTSHCCSIPSGATATGSASGSARTGAGRQEPGTSSGARISRFTVSPAPQRGDNLTRLGPLSSPCRAGNVKILRGARSVELFRILEGFPDLAHDDEVDASSGSLEILIFR